MVQVHITQDFQFPEILVTAWAIFSVNFYLLNVGKRNKKQGNDNKWSCWLCFTLPHYVECVAVVGLFASLLCLHETRHLHKSRCRQRCITCLAPSALSLSFKCTCKNTQAHKRLGVCDLWHMQSCHLTPPPTRWIIMQAGFFNMQLFSPT